MSKEFYLLQYMIEDMTNVLRDLDINNVMVGAVDNREINEYPKADLPATWQEIVVIENRNTKEDPSNVAFVLEGNLRNARITPEFGSRIFSIYELFFNLVHYDFIKKANYPAMLRRQAIGKAAREHTIKACLNWVFLDGDGDFNTDKLRVRNANVGFGDPEVDLWNVSIEDHDTLIGGQVYMAGLTFDPEEVLRDCMKFRYLYLEKSKLFIETRTKPKSLAVWNPKRGVELTSISRIEKDFGMLDDYRKDQ